MPNPLLPPTSTFSFLLELLHDYTLNSYLPEKGSSTSPPLPTATTLEAAKSKIIESIEGNGIGLEATFEHLVEDLVPALGRSSLSSRYYGFVTGGATPAALLADNLVTLTDTNVQVHLPAESLTTTLEQHTLSLLQEHLFRVPPTLFPGKIFTTGATAANILGLACGREHIFATAGVSVGELGLLEASRRSGIEGIDILSAAPHASVYKAAGVLGLGRDSVKDIGRGGEGLPWELDLPLLGRYLSGATAEGRNRGVIVVLNWGEVNTGKFTSGIREVRKLVDKDPKTKAWIHVDGAFGVFARMFWTEDGEGNGVDERLVSLGREVDGLECADSVTTDGHKMLNVPYDCGIFFTKFPSLLNSTLSAPAPYLNPASGADSTLSPLTLGLENSRRFRAFPVYASLVAYGASGYQQLVTTLILHARSIASHIFNHPAYELLPAHLFNSQSSIDKHVFTVVLFRAKDCSLNKILKERINFGKGGKDELGGMYVSGTVWAGKPAVRIAVCNWRVEVGEDGVGGWGGVRTLLDRVSTEWEVGQRG